MKLIHSAYIASGLNMSKRQLRRRLFRPFFRAFNTYELIEVLKRCGMSKGSNVFIQSSWGEFYKYTGTPEEFIEAVLEVIGPEGTLGMPAMPRNKYDTFDVNKTPSNAGYLTEVFRRYPGVKRSLNSQHSVCAIGPKADYLLNEHHLSDSCWDERSPYYKLGKINAIIFMLGLKPEYLMPTVWHCPESVLKDKFPYYSYILSKKIIAQYIDYSGNIFQHVYYTKPDELILKSVNRYKFLKKYFDKSKYIHNRFSNLCIRAYDSTYSINRLIELGSMGITRYDVPSASDFEW